MKENFSLSSSEDRGLTAKEFEEKNQELKYQIARQEAAQAKRPERQYLIFQTHEQQQQALALLRQGIVDGPLKQARWWTEDPNRRDVGIALEFAQTPEGYLEKVIEFFKQQGIMVAEHYAAEVPPSLAKSAPAVRPAIVQPIKPKRAAETPTDLPKAA